MMQLSQEQEVPGQQHNTISNHAIPVQAATTEFQHGITTWPVQKWGNLASVATHGREPPLSLQK